MALPFENLQAYQLSLRFVARTDTLIKEQGAISSRLSDQLSRAAISIPLNIAEGAGRWHKPEKKQFFWIARGSAFECVAILQVLKGLGLIMEADYELDYRILVEITRTLSGLIKATEKARPVSEPHEEDR